MLSSNSNNEQGFLTLHCRGMCILPACFAAICCHREAAGAWLPWFIILLVHSLPVSMSLWIGLHCWGPSGCWGAVAYFHCVFLLKLHTQIQDHRPECKQAAQTNILCTLPLPMINKWQFRFQSIEVFTGLILTRYYCEDSELIYFK